jgi:hypothetical protein
LLACKSKPSKESSKINREHFVENYNNGNVLLDYYKIDGKIDGEYRKYSFSGKLEEKWIVANGKFLRYYFYDTITGKMKFESRIVQINHNKSMSNKLTFSLPFPEFDHYEYYISALRFDRKYKGFEQSSASIHLIGKTNSPNMSYTLKCDSHNKCYFVVAISCFIKGGKKIETFYGQDSILCK